jgi:hypothetical protein
MTDTEWQCTLAELQSMMSRNRKFGHYLRGHGGHLEAEIGRLLDRDADTLEYVIRELAKEMRDGL